MSFSNKLSIITPVSRPQNLLIIQEFIPKESEWIIVSDGTIEIPKLSIPHIFIIGPKTCDFGNSQRQIGIQLASRDFVYFLDDDNIIIPTLPEICIPLANAYNADAILFGIFASYFEPYDIWFPQKEVVLKSVDTAMLLVRLDVLKKMYFDDAVGWPNSPGKERESDYQLIKKIEQNFKLIKLPALLGFHNALNNLKKSELNLIKKNSHFPYNIFFDRFKDNISPRWLI